MESEATAKAGSSEGANSNNNNNNNNNNSNNNNNNNKSGNNGLEDVTASLHRSLALLHQLHCTVATFAPTSQLALLERLNSLVVELSSMHNAAQNCHIQVPAEVVRFIDEGRNPDEFTKDLINNCIQQNQATKGKVDAFKMLRKHLLEEIDGAFPEEAEAYRELRTKSALELRRITQASSALPNGDVKVKTEH